MNFSFDRFHKLDDPRLYLCNPDGEEIAAIWTHNRNLTLRFNDLSQITFDVYPVAVNSRMEEVELDYYDKIQTKRLVLVENIGWFTITNVSEIDDGTKAKYKKVVADSLQTTLRNIGIITEERVYCLYNEDDPRDEKYTYVDESAIPSVVGQAFRQLGIMIRDDISNINFTPEEPYDQWTITYISKELRYTALTAEDSILRTLKKEEKNGYDFLVSTVEDAFGIIFDFDFLNKAIKVKTVAEATVSTNIYLSFRNLLKEIDLKESADDIVTVLNCYGRDLDITLVNPTGTNYIVDFSYYMKDGWMSDALVEKLGDWKDAVENSQDDYDEKIQELFLLQEARVEQMVKRIKASARLQDIKAVLDQYTQDNEAGNNPFIAEIFDIGEKSLADGSSYVLTALTGDEIVECYDKEPVFSGGVFAFPSGATSKTAKLKDNFDDGYLYFFDGDATSYCKIVSDGSNNDHEYIEAEHSTLGSLRVVEDNVSPTKYQINASDTKINNVEIGSYVVLQINEYMTGVRRYTTYNKSNSWYNKHYANVVALETAEDISDQLIKEKIDEMSEISDEINILKFFSDTPSLLRELKSYWVEGEYTDENLAVLEDTTDDERIKLAKELIENGRKELAKISQPRFSFTLDAINFLALYDFRQYMNELELGRTLTIEKEDGLHYQPALTEMSFSLDDNEVFSLEFSNALKLTDWGYTYADLVKNSANTSKNVSANWTNITAFSKKEEVIDSLLFDTLDRTLRSAKKGMASQEFLLDTSGILGRKLKDDSSPSNGFEDEQIRILNNLILFTDDGWDTAKTALGKIKYGENQEAYGLAAEVIIGDLILGSELRITNDNKTIEIDDTGICIKDGDNDVFKVNVSGDAFFAGEIDAKSGKVGNFSLEKTGQAPIYKTSFYSFSPENYMAKVFALTMNGNTSYGGSFYMRHPSLHWVGMPYPIECAFGQSGGYFLNLFSDLIFSRKIYIEDINISKQNVSYEGLKITETGIYGSSISAGSLGSSEVPYIKLNNGDFEEYGAYLSVNENKVRVTLIKAAKTPLSFRVFSMANDTPFFNILTVLKNETFAEAEFIGDFYDVSFINFDGTMHPISGETGLVELMVYTGYSTAPTVPTIEAQGDFIPSTDNRYSLGSSSKKWKYVYSNNAFQGSSRKIKKDILGLDDKYSVFFDNLEAVSYKLKDDSEQKTRFGFIAEDVENSLYTSGLNADDFVAVKKDKGEYGNIIYSLSYTEFIPIVVDETQKLKKRVSELEKEIKELKETK